MDYKIIKSDFNKDTGISIVKIRTNIGDFLGIAKLNFEDRDHMSNFIGCEIAEIRAQEQYISKKLFMLNAEIKGAEIILHAMNGRATYKAKRKIEQMRTQKEIYQKQIKNLQKLPYKILAHKEQVLKKLERIRQKRKKQDD